jgi:hypothetical protein
MAANESPLPTGSKERKDVPLVRGCVDYFPAALAYVARVSKAGNDKHNPGEEMHHARGKSSDHADCIARHLVDRGAIDPEDGLRHSGKVAWRALAMLQEELEAAGEAPLARGARLPADPRPELVTDFGPNVRRPVLAAEADRLAACVIEHEGRITRVPGIEVVELAAPITRRFESA